MSAPYHRFDSDAKWPSQRRLAAGIGLIAVVAVIYVEAYHSLAIRGVRPNPLARHDVDASDAQTGGPLDLKVAALDQLPSQFLNKTPSALQARENSMKHSLKHCSAHEFERGPIFEPRWLFKMWAPSCDDLVWLSEAQANLWFNSWYFVALRWIAGLLADLFFWVPVLGGWLARFANMTEPPQVLPQFDPHHWTPEMQQILDERFVFWPVILGTKVAAMLTLVQLYHMFLIDTTSQVPPYPIDQESLIHVFLAYQLSHNGYLYCLMDISVAYGFVNHATSVDWEAWDAWINWIFLVVNATALYKYGTNAGRNVKSSIGNVARMFMPVLGCDIHLAKDWVFISVAAQTCYDQSGWLAGLAMFICTCSVLFTVASVSTLREPCVESYIASHWPIISEGSDPHTPSPFSTWFSTKWLCFEYCAEKAIPSTTEAKEVVALRNEFPQVVLHLVYLMNFGARPVVVVTLGMSLSRVILMRIARLWIERRICHHCEPGAGTRLCIEFGKANRKISTWMKSDKFAKALPVLFMANVYRDRDVEPWTPWTALRDVFLVAIGRGGPELSLSIAGGNFISVDVAGYNTYLDSLAATDRHAAIEQLKILREACSVPKLPENTREFERVWGLFADAGFSAREFRDAGFTAPQARAARFPVRETLDAGLISTLQEARAVGFKAWEVRDAGFTAREAHDAGFISTAQEARAVGFTVREARDAGLISTARDARDVGFTAREARDADLISTAREAHDAGFTAREARDADLISTAREAHDAGFISTAQEASAAGFTAREACDAFLISTAREARDAGFTAWEACDAFFISTARESRDAGFTVREARDAGLISTPREARDAGFTVREALDAFLISTARKARDAGFTAWEARDAFFISTARESRDAGFTVREARDAGLISTAREARDAGFTAREARDAGLISTAREARDAGFTVREARDAGLISTARESRDAGFTVREARDAGFTCREARDADLISTAQEARDNGFTAREARDAGFTAREARAAGFTAREARDAGLISTARDARDVGFTAREARDAGLISKAREAHDAGFTAREARDAGLISTARDARDAGFTAREARHVGLILTAREADDAGFTGREARDAGFTARQIRDAFRISTVREARDAGFTVLEALSVGLG